MENGPRTLREACAPGGERDYFFDNLKAVLITLVVLAHFLLGFRVLERVYNLIYVFHMPLFVFASGVFSRNVFQNGRFRYNRLAQLLCCYLLFLLLDAAVRFCFHPELGFALPTVYISDTYWYLFALLLWSLSVPLVKDLKPWFALAAGILFALALGFFQEIGALFALSRTIVLYPYFLMGLYVKRDALESFLKNPRVRVVGLVAAAAVGAGVLWQKDFMNALHYLLFRESGYLYLPGLTGPVYRLLLGVATVVLSVGCMILIPRRRTWFSYIGARSLQIYILHVLVYKVMDGFGLLAVIGGLAPAVRVLCLLLPLGLTWLLAQRIFCVPFDAIKRIDFEARLTRPADGKNGKGPA